MSDGTTDEFVRLGAAPAPFGLTNTGSICYWNSLMQALMSCTSVAERLRAADNNAVGREYLRLVDGADPGQSDRVLQAMLAEMRRRGVMFRFGVAQESASEGLVLLLDMLPPAVSELFLHRYARRVRCGACGAESQTMREETVHFETFGAPTGAAEFQQWLMAREGPVDDYRCEACGQTSGQTTRREQLTMVPEVIVLLHNKYTRQSRAQSGVAVGAFEIPAAAGPAMRYEQVAQVRHRGGLGGGHYWALARRGGRCYLANDAALRQLPDDAMQPDPDTYMVFYHVV